MKREIYEAMKRRIEVVEEPYYWKTYPDTPKDATLYKFSSLGLNYDENYDFAFDIVQAFRTKNIWNIAQRFYSELKGNVMALDERLLHKEE